MTDNIEPLAIEQPCEPRTPPKYRKQRVSEGIRKDGYGYEAYVKVDGHQRSGRFSFRTPIRIIRVWREQTRAKMVAQYCPPKPGEPSYVPHPVFPARTSSLKKSLDGWCYLYVIQDRHHVKIGRAADPNQRLSELQTAHHRKLTLVCAVPAHAALERAVHERFASAQLEGEWFELTPELTWFIDELITGKNPVALLW